MEVETLTWNKKNHDLFDYENSELHRSKISIWDSGAIFRSNNICLFASNRNSITFINENLPLLAVEKTQEGYTLNSATQAEKDVWQILRFNFNQRGYEIKERDLFKLGRVLLRVKQISVANSAFKPQDKLLCEDISDDYSMDATCKICCCDDATDDNPLISPCNCTGSVKYVHVLCLRRWLESKITSRCSSGVTSYFWSDFVCELCKASLPTAINYKGKTIEFVEVKFPKTPYILFEDLRPSSHDFQIWHLVCLTPGQSIRIGRGQTSEIRITDISVSRNHAKLSLIKGKFVLYDNNSKFGTLISNDGEIKLHSNSKIALQSNRTVLKIACKAEEYCCCPSRDSGRKTGTFSHKEESMPQSPTFLIHP